MERRREGRVRRRMECELRFAGLRHRGVVVDASPQGLLVRTQAKPTSAAEVEIRVCLPGLRQATRLRATPVRMRLVPAARAGAAACALGLRVVEAPESYASFFDSGDVCDPLPDRRAPARLAPMRARRTLVRLPEDGSRFESRPAPAPTLVLDEEIGAEASVAAQPRSPVHELPLIQTPLRPQCGVCRRDDRPSWDGVCAWCHDHGRG